MSDVVLMNIINWSDETEKKFGIRTATSFSSFDVEGRLEENSGGFYVGNERQ